MLVVWNAKMDIVGMETAPVLLFLFGQGDNTDGVVIGKPVKKNVESWKTHYKRTVYIVTIEPIIALL